ncbi:MAG: hydrogenase expression/formation protein HypC [Actinomycetota bacterium]|jgi:hydrogenase expression/formation protein HypC|nr:hydrogenase expression/formation protein HypC [Actinomycetota bacterium]
MCLGIPGRVVEIMAGNAGQLALVDVLGAQRPINLGMLADPDLSPGDWILIHMGFALERIDEAGAQQALAGLQMMGSAGDAEDRRDGTGADGVGADRAGAIEDARSA